MKVRGQVSRSEVRVVCQFRNSSKHDISTLIAFPLPPIEIGEGGNYSFPSDDPLNVVNFQVSVEGRRVDPLVQMRATRFGVDVTNVLKKHSIPITLRSVDASSLRGRLNGLPQDARQELERYGIIDWTTIVGDGNNSDASPHWDAHISFYWFQTFPSGRSIEVTHRYHPVPRQFLVNPDELASTERQTTYCMDPGFIRSARKALQATAQKTMAGFELKYILSTAGKWSGPIGTFDLTVDKLSSEALVSLCATNLKRLGRTTFAFSQTEYTPSADLRSLFIEPIKN